MLINAFLEKKSIIALSKPFQVQLLNWYCLFKKCKLKKIVEETLIYVV